MYPAVYDEMKNLNQGSKKETSNFPVGVPSFPYPYPPYFVMGFPNYQPHESYPFAYHSPMNGYPYADHQNQLQSGAQYPQAYEPAQEHKLDAPQG